MQFTQDEIGKEIVFEDLSGNVRKGIVSENEFFKEPVIETENGIFYTRDMIEKEI